MCPDSAEPQIGRGHDQVHNRGCWRARRHHRPDVSSRDRPDSRRGFIILACRNNACPHRLARLCFWISESDASELRPPKIERGQTAFLPYTSGSTGVPKGVLLPHDGMLWGIRVAQKYWPQGTNDRALIAGPLFHKNAMRVSVKPKLRVGGSVVILPRFEPKAFLTALAEYHCTHTGGVPAMYRMVLAEEELLSRLEFPALKASRWDRPSWVQI